MTKKDEFISIYTKTITREGSAALLAYLQSPASDFFTAPASTRFHGSHEGGLVEHSINVYECMKDYLARPRVRDLYQMVCTDETVAIAALLHDVCKINVYKAGKRNVKDEKGVWQSIPTYEYLDRFPYGHGEKSVYMINNFMRLTNDEAFAIRYHMGFTATEETKQVGDAFKQFPLAFVLSTADMEATFLLEKE
jgi:23S rRNA maturation-related 3'-5' exoribonuclease YhaM